MKPLLVLTFIIAILCIESMRAVPVEVLTMSVSPTVVAEEFTIRIYNAYAASGGIKRAFIVGIRGDVLDDFTDAVILEQRGIQEIPRRLVYRAPGVYLIVLQTPAETISVKIVKL